jgi:hypothetical protein
MVQAWLHTDGSNKCFIGFTGNSPQIGNDTGTFQEGWTYPLKRFIDHFYYATIVEGKNVADALNDASMLYLFTTYSSSPLNLGYHAYCTDGPYGPDWYAGQMHVLGSRYIHLGAHYNTLSISSSAGGYTTPTGIQEYPENTVATVQAFSSPGYDFSGWLIDGWLQTSVNPLQIYIADDHTLYASFTPWQATHSLTVDGWCTSIWSEVYPDVWVYDDDTQTTWSGTAPITFYDLPNRDLRITVSVPQDIYPNMEFSHMYYDGGPLYSNPATITLSGDYYVTAYYFVPF